MTKKQIITAEITYVAKVKLFLESLKVSEDIEVRGTIKRRDAGIFLHWQICDLSFYGAVKLRAIRSRKWRERRATWTPILPRDRRGGIGNYLSGNASGTSALQRHGKRLIGNFEWQDLRGQTKVACKSTGSKARLIACAWYKREQPGNAFSCCLYQ